MKRLIPAILAILVITCAVSCKNQNKNNQSVVGAIEINDKLLTMDMNTFIEYYYHNDEIRTAGPVAQLLKEYGLGRIGDFGGSGGYKEEIFTKDCEYDSQNRQFKNWENKSQAITVSVDRTETRSFSHYIASVDDKELIFQKLKEAGYSCVSVGDNKFHHENHYIGIDTQLEGNTWVMRAIVRGDTDYPFKVAIGPKFYKDKMSNPLKMEQDYKGKNIKIRGFVEKVDQEYGGYVRYTFAINDSFETLWVSVPNADAFFNVDLPHVFTISGEVDSIDGYSIYLKNTCFYDENKKIYIGPHVPTYNTKTSLSVPSTSLDNGAMTEQIISDTEPTYKFTGYLTNGSKKYNIEMALFEQPDGDCVGYYRYTSQPADKKIKLHGYLESGTGFLENTIIAKLYTEEETERFEIYIEEQEKTGHWYKYNNAEDCRNAENNYSSLLEVVLK